MKHIKYISCVRGVMMSLLLMLFIGAPSLLLAQEKGSENKITIEQIKRFLVSGTWAVYVMEDGKKAVRHSVDTQRFDSQGKLNFIWSTGEAVGEVNFYGDSVLMKTDVFMNFEGDSLESHVILDSRLMRDVETNNFYFRQMDTSNVKVVAESRRFVIILRKES